MTLDKHICWCESRKRGCSSADRISSSSNLLCFCMSTTYCTLRRNYFIPNTINNYQTAYYNIDIKHIAWESLACIIIINRQFLTSHCTETSTGLLYIINCCERHSNSILFVKLYSIMKRRDNWMSWLLTVWCHSSWTLQSTVMLKDANNDQ